MNLPPLAGALLLIVAIAAQIVCSRLHVDAGEWIASLGAFGVAVMWGTSHAKTEGQRDEARAELVALRKSITPPHDPSTPTLPPIASEDHVPVVTERKP